MSISLIPDSAPFTSDQRAWLNGFLAGWTGLDGEANGNGNGSTALLEAVPQELSANGDTSTKAEAEEQFPWHDESLSMDERLSLADGKPLKRRLMAAMAQLDCGACGYVCKTYSEAIADGAEKNLTLCAPGGKETSKMLKKLLKEEGGANGTGSATAATTNGTAASVNGTAKKISRTNPYPAKIKECRNLNGTGSAKHTSHVVIDLAGSGLDYRVGDALGVYPTNCPDLVNEIMALVNFNRSNGAGDKLRHALTNELDLNNVEEELVEALIASATDADERSALHALIQEDKFSDVDVLDVLQMAPSARLDAAQLTEQLTPINPRLYSIASSLKKHPDEVHLTIAKVTYNVNGRLRKGVASTMFADRLQPGEPVRVFTHAASDFTVPADPHAPMIMVGPGTGIAPFRAFLQERAATGAPGKNWLFFGDQRATTDFLYQSELDELRQCGALTRLDTAFSRDQKEKVYVQHRMLENGEELFRWLEDGGYFFVCGDARRMAVDVDCALHDVIATHGKLSVDDASAYVKRLKESGRYVRDVY